MSDEDGPLYHLVAQPRWDAAKQRGEAYFPPTYEQDGFTHLTAEPAYLIRVGNMFYKDSPPDQPWVLLVLDQKRLTSKIIFEPAAPVGDKPTSLGDSSSSGQHDGSSSPVLFPHLYGPIDLAAVTQELPIERDPSDGTFLSIPGLVNRAG